jgi:hypothetical protein
LEVLLVPRGATVLDEDPRAYVVHGLPVGVYTFAVGTDVGNPR